MRLTLRTLLAYLDDILEPSETKEIGAKVNESGFASMLVNRIRDVLRRRRLTAPELSGPGMGLDPNDVAEYLDNTLSPEAVADVEKVCLDSDVHLAEVAACHQVLTLVLGEPVDVVSSTRERMYALRPRRKPAPKAADEESQKPESKNASAESAPLSDTIPDYLRPTPVWKRFVPVAICLLIGGLWCGVVFRNSIFNSGSDTDQQELAQNDAGSAGNDAEAGNESDSTGTTQTEAKGANSTAGQGQTTGSTTPGNAIASTNVRPISELPNFDPKAPPDQPEESATKPSGTNGESGTAAAVTNPAPLATTPNSTSPQTTATTQPITKPQPKAGETAPVVADPPARPSPEVLYVSRDGVLVHETPQGWTVMPRRSVIRPGDRIASLVPYTTVLEVDQHLLTLQLHGGTAVEFVGATEKHALAFRILEGRIALKRHAGDGNNAPLVVGILLYGEPCSLSFESGDALAGIQITPEEPGSFEEDISANPYEGGVYFVEGQGSFQGGTGNPVQFDGPGWLAVSRKSRADGAGVEPLLATPDWLTPAGPRVTTTLRRYAVQFEKEIDPELVMNHSVPAIIADAPPRLAEFAVQALAVTNHVAELVQALGIGKYEVKEAAITGLRRWLPQAEENRELLKRELQKNFPPDQVDPIYRLLWGYNESDARNQTASQLLVDWLRHDSPAIRHLAFRHIYRLTGQKLDYGAYKPPGQRKVAADRWSTYLNRNGGVLLK